jgi:iron complex outermembrane receptor protein
VPTFNDLYWNDGGNPHLKPERSLSIDAGLVAQYGSLRLEADYFSIRTHDRIVWTPGSGGIWSPKNIATVGSEGIEAEMTWDGFDRALMLTVNSTVMTARKKTADYPGDPTSGKVLPYVPRQTANVSVLFTRAPITVFAQHTWASYRYTTEINDRFLPRYGVTSGAITFAYPLAASVLSLKLECTNLFNTSYQAIALYPMPLRELRATLGVEL